MVKQSWLDIHRFPPLHKSNCQGAVHSWRQPARSAAAPPSSTSRRVERRRNLSGERCVCCEPCNFQGAVEIMLQNKRNLRSEACPQTTEPTTHKHPKAVLISNFLKDIKDKKKRKFKREIHTRLLSSPSVQRRRQCQTMVDNCIVLQKLETVYCARSQHSLLSPLQDVPPNLLRLWEVSTSGTEPQRDSRRCLGPCDTTGSFHQHDICAVVT